MANPIPTVHDGKHHPLASPPVRFTYDAGENGGLSLRIQLFAHGIHPRPTAENFHHPRPAVTRLFLFEKGHADVDLGKEGGGSLRLLPGRIHLLPQDQSFRIRYSAGSVLFFFHLGATSHLGMPTFSGMRGIPSLKWARTKVDEFLAARRGNELPAWHGLLLQAVLEFAPMARPETARREAKLGALSGLIAHIHAHPGEACTVDHLSRTFGIPRHALSKKFRRAMGVPLKRYLLQVQVGRAQELLATTHDSLERISEALGFTHAPYFHRFFKRATGMTPGAYRASQAS